MNIHQEQDGVGFLDREVHLFADLSLEHIVASADVSTGIHYAEHDTVPFGLAVVAVAGGACDVVRDRLPLFDQAIEEGAFSDVRPTYDSDDVTHVQ